MEQVTTEEARRLAPSADPEWAGEMILSLAAERDAAVARAEEAERDLTDIGLQLGGLRDSQLAGRDGLAAATMRDRERLRSERDRYRAALAELGGDLEATAASPGKAYIQGVTDITTWREAEDARDAAREVGGE